MPRLKPWPCSRRSVGSKRTLLGTTRRSGIGATGHVVRRLSPASDTMTLDEGLEVGRRDQDAPAQLDVSELTLANPDPQREFRHAQPLCNSGDAHQGTARRLLQDPYPSGNDYKER